MDSDDVQETAEANASGQSPRACGKRISRACDECNRRRVKCNGTLPCSRCKSPDTCTFTRKQKKRGKRAGTSRGNGNVMYFTTANANKDRSPPRTRTVASPASHDFAIGSQPEPATMADRSAHEEATGLDNGPPFPWDAYSGQHDGMSITFSKQINRDEEGIKPPFTLGDFNRTEPGYQSAYRFSTVFVSCTDHGDGSTGQELGNVSTPTGQQHDSGTPGSWCDVEYPVLKPLMPYIHSFLTPAHACSLLECYFASAVGQHFHPLCPYVHVFLFRKASFLAVNNPRPCSPALLASMLWVSIKSGHGSLPVWSLHERRQLSKRLYILTMQLLKPLLHADLGCLDCDFLSREHCHWKCTSKKRGRIVWAEGYFYYPPSLDDVITYIHIAAIASMSEHKATSMRWWQAAFDMARELKLNIDPCTRSTSTSPHCRPNVSGSIQPQNTTDPWSDLTSFSLEYDGINMAATDHDLSMQAGTTECDNVFSEEQREERRRIWWLLYIQDRYLALCYNRAISILDAECAELCLPMDEPTWQSGAFLGGLSTDTPIRPQFHSFECTGSNIFGFFLPLMTILGEVLDHGRNQSHPLLGLRYRGNGVSSAVENTIIHHITTYQISLTQFKTLQQTSSLRTEGYAEHDNLHIEIVIAYATYVSHVLHVLLSGKWDPLSLLDKENSWVSSPSFLKAITHALNAADVVSQILTLDPELTFMPYFLGILLLQGSLVLLMALEWLHVDSEPRVITACEAIVRATEVCMATLDTEYQRQYRRLLSSAIARARGRPVSEREAQHRRKTVLATYRWSCNGTGLAL